MITYKISTNTFYPSSVLSTIIIFLSLISNFDYVKTSEDEVPEENFVNEVTQILPNGILNNMKNLTEWAIKEEIIYKLSKVRLQRLKIEMKMLEEYIEDYEETTHQSVIHAVRPLKTAEERGKFVASSGTTAYRMIYRYATHLANLKEFLSEGDHQLHEVLRESQSPDEDDSDLSSGTLEDLFHHGSTSLSSWPNWVEVNDAMRSFLHIHEAYDFPVEDFAAVLSIETNHPTDLTAFHCVQVALYALTNEFYALAIDWLEYGTRKIVSEGDATIPLIVIDNYMTLAIQLHNDAFKRLPLYDYTVFSDTITNGADLRIKRRTKQYETFKGLKDEPYVTINYWGLCSGENLQSQEEKASLNCYYEHKSHPAWYINPLKVEVLAKSPPTLQIYEVLGDKMIQEIISRSEKSLTRSGVLGNTHSTERSAKSRTSVNSWIDDDEVPNLTRKIEKITGLKLFGDQASEKLQVVEYVFGRYYGPHTDPLDGNGNEDDIKWHEKLGDRAATFLFYLNDVDAGGNTPFCNAGTFAPPVKGSAIYWLNMFRNGTVRHDTWHASCPVIYGHKIVANKWIRYNAQFQTFQCSLDPNE